MFAYNRWARGGENDAGIGNGRDAGFSNMDWTGASNANAYSVLKLYAYVETDAMTGSTASPTTASPSTRSPITISPTSVSPTSVSPSSAPAAPSTVSPTSASPTSASPTSASPTSASPTSHTAAAQCVPGTSFVLDNESPAPFFFVQELGGAAWVLKDDKPGAYSLQNLPTGSFLSDERENKGLLTATFASELGGEGLYRVHLYYNPSTTRAPNVPVVVHDADGDVVLSVDQSTNEAADNFHHLGDYVFLNDGLQARVTVSNANTPTDKKVENE
mgnify:CR=1 FL=1